MEDYKLDLTMDIEEDVLDEVLEYLNDDDCDLVRTLSMAGLSFPAIMFIINSIFYEEKRYRQMFKETKHE